MTFSPWHSSDGTCPLKPSEHCRHLWALTCQEQVYVKIITNILIWKDSWRVFGTTVKGFYIKYVQSFFCVTVYVKMSRVDWTLWVLCFLIIVLRRDWNAVTIWHLCKEHWSPKPSYKSHFTCNTLAERFVGP